MLLSSEPDTITWSDGWASQLNTGFVCPLSFPTIWQEFISHIYSWLSSDPDNTHLPFDQIYTYYYNCIIIITVLLLLYNIIIITTIIIVIIIICPDIYIYIYYNSKQTDRPSGTQSRDAGKSAWSLEASSDR